MTSKKVLKDPDFQNLSDVRSGCDVLYYLRPPFFRVAVEKEVGIFIPEKFSIEHFFFTLFFLKFSKYTYKTHTVI